MPSKGGRKRRQIHTASVVATLAVILLLPRPSNCVAKPSTADGTSRSDTADAPLVFRDGHVVKKLIGLDIRLPSPMPLVRAYLGIQYAALGKLDPRTEHRFGRSVATMKYNYYASGGTFYQNNFKPVCPQNKPSLAELQAASSAAYVEHVRRILPYLRYQDEECLYLNIYKPVLSE